MILIFFIYFRLRTGSVWESHPSAVLQKKVVGWNAHIKLVAVNSISRYARSLLFQFKQNSSQNGLKFKI